MKKKLHASLAVILALLLLGAVALAVGLSKSAEYTTVQKARGALEDRYGLTQGMLTLFDDQTTETDGQTTVTFATGNSNFINADAAGTYTVVIGQGGEAEASWSHDDADPDQWRDADLTSAVWGAPQLEAALERYETYQQWWKDHADFGSLPEEEQTKLLAELRAAIAPLELPEDGESITVNPTPSLEITPTPEPEDEAAVSAARQALKDRYSLTDDMLALFTPVSFPDPDETQTLCTVDFLPVDSGNPGIADWRWTDTLAEKLGSYSAQVDVSDDSVVDAAWSLDGADDSSAYDQSDWGSAKAYDARILPWVIQLLDATEPIAARYPEDQTDWFSVEDAAAYDQAFRDAGFGSDAYSHALPGEDDITEEQAVAYARQAMREEYGLTEDRMDAYTLTTEYCLDDGGTWYVDFYSSDGMGRVTLGAEDGEIRMVKLDSGAGGNG